MQPAVTTRQLFAAVALLSIAGIAVSSVSLYDHHSSSPSSFCDFGGNFNCDLVNRSIYSTVLGIPVALIGIVGYVAIFVLAVYLRSSPSTPARLLLASLLGLGFALYLTYVEAFVLAVWCVLCLSSLGLILAIAVCSGLLLRSSRPAD